MGCCTDLAPTHPHTDMTTCLTPTNVPVHTVHTALHPTPLYNYSPPLNSTLHTPLYTYPITLTPSHPHTSLHTHHHTHTHLLIQCLVMVKEALQRLQHFHLRGHPGVGSLSLHNGHPQRLLVTRDQALQVLHQELQRGGEGRGRGAILVPTSDLPTHTHTTSTYMPFGFCSLGKWTE